MSNEEKASVRMAITHYSFLIFHRWLINWNRFLWLFHSPTLLESLGKNPLNLSVRGTELVSRPRLYGIHHRGVKAKNKILCFSHNISILYLVQYSVLSPTSDTPGIRMQNLSSHHSQSDICQKTEYRTSGRTVQKHLQHSPCLPFPSGES